MSTYLVHAATLGASPQRLAGMTGVAVEAGRGKRLAAGAGNRFHRMAAATVYAQRLNLTTTGVKQLLLLLNQTMATPCADLSTVGPLDCFAIKADDVLPADASGTVHEKLSIAKGLIYVPRFSWEKPGEALIAEVVAMPLSADGAASGWATTLVAAPTTPGVDADYDLATLTLGGATLTGVSGLEIRCDLSPQPQYNPGNIYPTYIRSVNSQGAIPISASFTCADRDLLRSAGQHFRGDAVQTLALTFQRFKPQAARDATDNFSMSLVGAVTIDSASDQRPGSVRVTIDGITADGATTPFDWTP
jgi:hypothetical protein